MATFKVGQRVKKVRHNGRVPGQPGVGHLHFTPLGAEGVIEEIAGSEVAVLFDGMEYQLWGFPWQFVPLTDPQADAFMEGLKKLAREPQPVVREAEKAILK